MPTFFLAAMIRGRALLSVGDRSSWINRGLKAVAGLAFYGLAIVALALLAAAEWWMNQATRRGAGRNRFGDQ